MQTHKVINVKSTAINIYKLSLAFLLSSFFFFT